jgi:hypothetical protein
MDRHQTDLLRHFALECREHSVHFGEVDRLGDRGIGELCYEWEKTSANFGTMLEDMRAITKPERVLEFVIGQLGPI